MDDPHLVQNPQSLQYLSPPLPDLVLLESLPPLETRLDLSSQIPSMRQLHYQVQFTTSIVKNSLPVLHDVGVVNRRQNPHFVESIALILFLEIEHFDLN